MATPKRKNMPSILEELKTAREEIESLPLVDERWVVSEYTPPSEDEYGSWVSDKHKVVAIHGSEEEAQAFVDGHDPAPGTTFIIRHEFLREWKHLRWGPA